MAIEVQTLLVGEYQMNCYLVENTLTHALIVVDPGADGEAIIQAIGWRKPAAVLLTAGQSLARAFPVPGGEVGGAVLLLFLDSALYRLYQCGTSGRSDLFLPDFCTDGQ